MREQHLRGKCYSEQHNKLKKEQGVSTVHNNL